MTSPPHLHYSRMCDMMTNISTKICFEEQTVFLIILLEGMEKTLFIAKRKIVAVEAISERIEEKDDPFRRAALNVSKGYMFLAK